MIMRTTSKNKGATLLLALLALVACSDSGSDRPQPSEAVYSLVMTETGSRKIAVIKAIREVTGLGLRDAKNLADLPPCVVLSGLGHDEATAAAEKLTSAGAKVELKRN